MRPLHIRTKTDYLRDVQACLDSDSKAPLGDILVQAFEDYHDEEEFARYRQAVMPTLEPFGARFLVRGGAFTVLEGDMPFSRIAIMEFPSREAAEEWYDSDAYQAVLPIRLGAADCQFVIVDAADSA